MKKKARRREQVVTPVPSALPQLLFQNKIHIDGVAVRSLSYRETATLSLDVATSRADSPNINWDINQGISLLSTERVAAEFRFKCAVDPQVRPIVVEGELHVLFSRENDVPAATFIAYVNTRAGIAVVPYLRELISSVTGRGIYGALFLDPFAITSVLPAEQAKEIAESYDALITARNATQTSERASV